MTETKRSSMTPEESRLLPIRNARVERIFREESALVPIRQYSRAMKEFSEAEHAAFLRGFEAAREAVIERLLAVSAEAKLRAERCRETSPAAYREHEIRLTHFSNAADLIRALTPADARASAIPGAASETDPAKGQSTEGAQPPGIS